MSVDIDDRRGEANRLRLGVALALTVVAIGTGTWVLGSGSDPADVEQSPVVAERAAPERARPPLVVAPPPVEADERASRKAERRAR